MAIQHAARFTAAMLIVCSAGAAYPAGLVEGQDGRHLAESWCADCHQISGRPATQLDQMAPAFDAIANQPSTTELSLRAFLTTPHADMPDIRLTRPQIDELVAYLLSMRRE